ncbi:receptor-type guanylate cyclase gcy-4-like [Homalodisca vitripennis]|nr:receptor-type guanylate cyclase gcy-4-like [Homalodisca vitripennis]
MEFHWGLLLATLLCLIHSNCAERCLRDVPEVNPKRYMKVNYDFKKMPIILDVSRRITHQITSYIFKIFLEEELGYNDVLIVENNDRFNQSKQTRSRLEAGVGEKDRPPETVLNNEVWLSPEGDPEALFEEHRVKQCGPVGPPGRFGWFIPKTLLNNRNLLAYWETFISPDKAKLFALTDSEMELVQTFSKDDDSGYFCNEDFCNNGIYTPQQCERQTCAVLLAGFTDSTEFVVLHIERLKLLVRVVWVGPHLNNIVTTLTANLASTTRSLVFLTFTPSIIVPPDDQNYVTVAFPPCDDFSQDIGCKYDLHTLTKLYATLFESGAVPAFYAYTKMHFNQSEFKDLLMKYKAVMEISQNSTEAVIQVACDWLKNNPETRRYWNNHEENVLYIGGIFPVHPVRSVAYDASSIIIAAQLAQEAVNNNKSVLRDYRLELKAHDGRCEADAVLKAFIDLILRQQYKSLIGILGPACSNALEPLAGVSNHYNTMVISYSAEGSSFSDRKKYPYFFRTIGENNQYQQVYLQMLTKLNWRRVAALTEDGQKYTEYLSHLQDLLTSKNYSFVINRKFPAVRDKLAMRSYLEEMKSRSVRIIIGDVYDSAAREMMCQAYQLQMTAYQSYVWFLPAWLAPDWYDTDRYNKKSDSSETVPCSTAEMLEAINGHLSLSHAAWALDNAIMQTKQTVGEWKENLKKTVVGITNQTTISTYAGYAYDAVWMFALALDQLNKEDPSALSNIHENNNTQRYMEILEKTDFYGVSGHIQFKGGSSRISVVEVIQWVDNVTQIVGKFEPNKTILNKDPLAGTLYLNESMIVWLNPEKTKPEDGTIQCFLGLAEYFGVYDCNLFLAIVNVIGLCILALFVIGGFLVVKNRYDRKVKLTQQYMHSIGLDLLNVGTLEKWEIPRDKVVINRKLGEGAFGYVYGGEAYFDSKGWVAVAVKTLKIGSTPEQKLEFLCEAEVMKRFEHKNIVQLLGICTKNEPVYTVMEFMLYGDLKTFLLARRHLVNEKIGEEADEVSSKKLTTMALDVARALSYLAELKFVHRDVASRNCLVNGNRVVKLGDFGMTRPMFEKDYYKFSRKGMLPVRWMSPESLGLGLFTPASDVWSYGVLLYEIITFGSFPFQGMGNNQVLEHVKAGNSLDIPSGVKPQAEALMRSCWNVDYKKRPKASEIVEFIANNPRLLQPCLEGPLASVQIDDSGSVDLLHTERTRKFSFSLRKRNSSGVFNSPFVGGVSNSNGVGTPAIWSQEEPDPESPSQLYPVGEEGPEWNHPLLNTPDKYVVVKTPPSNHYTAYEASQEDSLL